MTRWRGINYLCFGLWFLVLVLTLKARALPSLISSQWWKGRNSGIYSEFNVTNKQSYWTDEYTSAELLVGFGAKNIWSLGYQASLGSPTNRRDAWHINYDFNFGNQNSINFKYLHQNWYWLGSGKESIGLAMNSSTSIGLFYRLGYYLRWLKQSWNSKPYDPFNFDTDDFEGFLIASLGWKYMMAGKAYWTFDINNSDYFSYYSADNWATDFRLSLPMGTYAFNSFVGIRWSGVLALAPYPATGYFGLGLAF